MSWTRKLAKTCKTSDLQASLFKPEFFKPGSQEGRPWHGAHGKSSTRASDHVWTGDGLQQPATWPTQSTDRFAFSEPALVCPAGGSSSVVFDLYRRGPHNALPSQFEPFNAKASTHKHPETGLPGQDTDPCQLSHASPHSRVQHSFLTRLHDGDHSLWPLMVGPISRNQDGCFCAACSKVEHPDGRIAHFDRM